MNVEEIKTQTMESSTLRLLFFFNNREDSINGLVLNSLEEHSQDRHYVVLLSFQAVLRLVYESHLLVFTESTTSTVLRLIKLYQKMSTVEVMVDQRIERMKWSSNKGKSRGAPRTFSLSFSSSNLLFSYGIFFYRSLTIDNQ